MKNRFDAEDVDAAAMLAELRHWVELETPTLDAARVNRLVDHVATLAQSFGLVVERLAGRDRLGDALIVRSAPPGPREEKGALILAHLDTVHPVGTLADELPWREAGERIYGPGIYDMKAGALMALYALKMAAQQPGPDFLPTTIVFAPDEETGSVTSKDMIVREAEQAKFVLVVEPARDGGKIVTARKGVGVFDIHVKGRPSHAGSKPLEGRSAIKEAARIVLALDALNDPARGVTVTTGTIRGGSARNVVPEHCALQVDFRIADMIGADEIVKAIRAIGSSDPDIKVEIIGGLNRPPFVQSERSKKLFDHTARLGAALGLTVEGVFTGGGSDGNFTAAADLPTLDGLGADGAGAHTHEEYILKASVPVRTALIANILDTARAVAL
ncbi:M20 family metallopeptidase [Methylocapsa sp. S129]|uniref:M20 family metallopeptidase n=1 Tax=Methylocapsa sp. S129 TaxID=1641869 RepID=UPI00131B6D7D|nr:M20 family metallopeptidase [Methylocapsa sp. S129]